VRGVKFRLTSVFTTNLRKTLSTVEIKDAKRKQHQKPEINAEHWSWKIAAAVGITSRVLAVVAITRRVHFLLLTKRVW
jgi:hypothetical protein